MSDPRYRSVFSIGFLRLLVQFVRFTPEQRAEAVKRLRQMRSEVAGDE